MQSATREVTQDAGDGYGRTRMAGQYPAFSEQGDRVEAALEAR